MKNRISNISDKILTSIQASNSFSKKECDEIAFHMTDWFDDLCLIYKTFNSIDTHTDKEILDNIIKFLLHAPEHINQASNLLVGTEINNIFDDSEE